jgi:hypothetical protein
VDFAKQLSKKEKQRNRKMADKETMAALHEQERIIKLIKTMRDTMFSSPQDMDALIKMIKESGP